MALVSQAELREAGDHAPAWHQRVLADLAGRLTPPSDFPCTFSQNAFRRDLLLFSFVETLSPADLSGLRSDLSDYVALSRRWDGEVNSAHPLIVAFSGRVAKAETPGEYHAIGWSVLQDWLDHDPGPWPPSVARDPNAPFWSMCFDGMQLFVNMSSPAHDHRRSRNLGAHLLFIVNPRERFDMVAGDSPEGRRVRAAIRRRAEAYDGQPHAPELGSYQAGEIEWVQYALPDQNRPRTERCPLRMRKED